MMANAGSFVKGVKRPNQGKRGPNKAQAELKDMVLGALNRVGGEDYLVARAKDRNRAPFLSLVSKCLPKDLQVTANVTLSDLLREAETRRSKRV